MVLQVWEEIQWATALVERVTALAGQVNPLEQPATVFA